MNIYPIVSIIINNYNYGCFIKEAIDSALNQSYPNVELVVVDDGSTDTSKEIISNYKGIISILKENGGQASALNAGFKASTGEIIIFLDADDYLFPDAVAQVVAAWKPGLAKLHYRLHIIDGAGNIIGDRPGNGVTLDQGNVLPSLLAKGGYITMPTSGNAFSRSALTQALPIPEEQYRISADGYLIIAIPFYGEVGAIEQPLGAYRKHGSNQWAISQQTVTIEALHRLIKHDFQKYELLMAQASELGYSPPEMPGVKDYFHLRHRLASLRLDPQTHPITSDFAPVLAYRGLRAVWVHSTFAWKKKLILSAWFLAVGLLPRFLAEPMITWLLASASRSQIRLPMFSFQRQP